MQEIGLEKSENRHLDTRFENRKKGHMSASRETRTFEFEQVWLQAKDDKGGKGGKGGKGKKGQKGKDNKGKGKGKDKQ